MRGVPTESVAVSVSVLCLLIFVLAGEVIKVQGSCISGDNLQNEGGSCNFDALPSNFCDWVNPEVNNLTWKADYNPEYVSPCISSNMADLKVHQIVRLKSPLLCATNTSFFTYQMQFLYSMSFSDRCHFSVSLSTAPGDKLTEVWNTKETTFEPRSRGWKTVSLDINNEDGPFYIIFAAERISSAETTKVYLDTITYTSHPVTTTTSTTATTSSASTTTLPTTERTTTSSTTSISTSSLATPTTPPPERSTTPIADDATLIWGLHRDVVIAIGAGIVVVLVLIIVITIVCRRAKRQEDVKTVSFALASPTKYDVNETKSNTGIRHTVKKVGTSVLTPSKQKTWEPDMSLY